MIDEIFGYKFKNPKLLEEALTHRSMNYNVKEKTEENKIVKFDNQRLEFLGDSVIGLIIAEKLYANPELENEGDLSKRRACLINSKCLSQIALNFNIDRLIIMDDSEIRNGGLSNPNILEDALEAIIGAIYLDSDLVTTSKIVNTVWQPYIEESVDTWQEQNPKSTLQEWLQKNKHSLPKYRTVKVYGASHSPKITISLEVALDGEVHKFKATASNKKQAQESCARAAIEHFNIFNSSN